MKIGVFSDIHGNLEALESIIDKLKEENVERIICLGDVVGLGPNSKQCLDLIINNNIDLILGNHELYCIHDVHTIEENIDDDEIEHHEYIKNELSNKHLEFLRKCPINLVIKYKDKTLHFTHFLIKDKTKALPFYPLSILKSNYDYILNDYDADYIFIGHQHNPFRNQVGNTLLVDVGSSGARKDDFTTYYILDISDEIKLEGKIANYNRELFEDKISNSEYPEKEKIAKMFFGINV